MTGTTRETMLCCSSLLWYAYEMEKTESTNQPLCYLNLKFFTFPIWEERMNARTRWTNQQASEQIESLDDGDDDNRGLGET